MDPRTAAIVHQTRHSRRRRRRGVAVVRRTDGAYRSSTGAYAGSGTRRKRRRASGVDGLLVLALFGLWWLAARAVPYMGLAKSFASSVPRRRGKL